MESLPPEVLRRLAPAAFFAPFLAERTRPDGRGFEETRETSVVLGEQSPSELPLDSATQSFSSEPWIPPDRERGMF